MVALLALIIVISISLLVTRVGSLALTLTGLSRELARFQARSAFTGVGFTTSEAEMVVNHPVRRRILMMLMLVGNAGIVTVIATVVVTFTQGGQEDEWLLRIGVLALAFLALWFITWNRWVDRRLSAVIAWALRRWTHVDARDYSALLHLSGNYRVMELQVNARDWLADKTLAEVDLPHEGVLILGIHKGPRAYVGAPTGQTRIHAGDTLILYGRFEILEDLDRRSKGRSGDKAHEKAKRTHRQELEEQAHVEKYPEAG